MKLPVLILGVEPRISIPIARSLARQGVPVDMASLSESEPPPRSRAVHQFHRLPGNDPIHFREALTHLISERKCDMLVPATDAALSVIGEHDATLRSLLHVACPPVDIVQRVLNKSITLDLARKSGICVPLSFRPATLTELEAISSQLSFPLVAKPFHKSSETNFKVRYFHSYEALRDAFAADDQLGFRIVLQEYAQGDGVGVEVLMHRGQPVAMFQHRRLKEVPHTGGAAAVAVAELLDPFLADQAIALLRALEWEGVAMVEFRYNRAERKSALMEVNGRYWGTLALPIKAGVDFPWYAWQIVHGEKPTVPDNYSVGLRWRWTAGYIRRWHGILPIAIKHPGEMIPSVSDVFSRDALWSFSDPMPALAEAARQSANLLSSDVRSILRKVLPGRPRQGTAKPKPLAVSEPVAEKSKISA